MPKSHFNKVAGLGKIHRENCVFLNSVQEFIEIEALADSDPFHMFTQSNNSTHSIVTY